MPTAQNRPSNRHKGPRQAYFNKSKFQPYRHCTERTPDHSFLRPMTSLCCQRCAKKLQWKVEYAKYVPQEKPRKCNLCQQKSVVIAYHRICQDCSRQHVRCAKCQLDPQTANQSDMWERRDGDDDDDEGSDAGDARAPEAEEQDGAENAAGASDELSAAAIKDKFAAASDDDEELCSLRGLDVSLLRAQKRKIRAMEDEANRALLRERERRTLARQERGAGRAGHAADEDLSSDEEEL